MSVSVASPAGFESHTGTTGNASSSSFTIPAFTVPSGARSMVVFVCTVSGTKTVTAVSDITDGQSLTDMTALAVVDSATEPGRIDVFFRDNLQNLGDPHTISISRTNNAVVMYAVAVILMASGPTEIYTTGAIALQGDGSLSAQTPTDNSPGTNSQRLAACYYGGNAPAPVAASTTQIHEIDLGSFGFNIGYETTPGQGARAVGFTQATSDDRAAIHFAVRETSQIYIDSGTVPLAITPSSADVNESVDSGTVYVTITPSGVDEYTSGGTEYLDSGTVYVDITPSGTDLLAKEYTDANTVYVTITPSSLDAKSYELLFSDSRLISNGFQAIAAGAGKNLYHVYRNGSNIVMKKSTDEGATWGSESSAIATATSIELTIPLYVGTDGVLHLLYVRDDVLYYKRSTDDGGSWSTEQTIHDSTGASGLYRTVVKAFNGIVHVWWVRHLGAPTGGGQGTLHCRRSTNNGVSFAASTQPFSGSSFYRQNISRAPGGTIHFTAARRIEAETELVSDSEIIYSYSTDDGANWQTPVVVAGGLDRWALYPDIVAVNDNVIIISYREDLTASDELKARPFTRRSTNGGSSWGDPIAHGDQVGASHTSLSAIREFVVLTFDIGSSPGRARVSVSENSGASWNVQRVDETIALGDSRSIISQQFAHILMVNTSQDGYYYRAQLGAIITELRLSANADDGNLETWGPSYPPTISDPPTTGQDSIGVRNSHPAFGGNFNYVRGDLYLRYDTSVIPDNARIVTAKLRFKITQIVGNANGMQFRLDYFAWGPTLTTGDYNSAVASGTAYAGKTIASLTVGDTYEVELLNPDTNIVKNGYTEFRGGIGPGTPAGGSNHIEIAGLTSSDTEPQGRAAELIIAYVTEEVDAQTVYVTITPSGTDVYEAGGTEYTDADTVYVNLDTSSSEIQESIDSATVYITITPGAVERYSPPVPIRRWERPRRIAGLNPILRNGPDQGTDTKVGPSVVWRDGTTYKMFHEGIDSSLDPDGAGNNLYNSIHYATAPNPKGPWTKQGEVVAPLASPNWETSEVCPDDLVWNPETSKWHLYYHGGNNSGPRAIGLMTATDSSITGSTVWTRHANNPILEKGTAGQWDEFFVSDCKVFRIHATLWLMAYVGRINSGAGRVGLATSTDGITWTKASANPVLGFGASGQWDDADIQAFAAYQIKDNEWMAYYVGRDTIPGGTTLLGRAYSKDWMQTWRRDNMNPVLGDATDDDLSDSINILDADGAHHIYYGTFDFVGDTLRGKGYAVANEAVVPAAPLVDDAERADDASPPPGSEWVQISGRTAGQGLVVLGGRLTKQNAAGYRHGNAWGVRQVDGHPQLWVEIAQVPTGSFAGTPGFSAYLRYTDPATTGIGSAGNGFDSMIEWNSATPTLILYPSGNGGKYWTSTFPEGNANNILPGDILAFEFDGARCRVIRYRDTVRTVILDKAYNDNPDVGGTWTANFNTANIGADWWGVLDVMADQQTRFESFGVGGIYQMPTVVITPSGVDELTTGGTEYLDSNTVYVDIDASATETREITDTGTVSVVITPSGVEVQEAVDAATVYVDITPGSTEVFGPGSRYFDGVDDTVTFSNESVYDFERTSPHTILLNAFLRDPTGDTGNYVLAAKQGGANFTGYRIDTREGLSGGRRVRVNLRNQFGNQILVTANADVSRLAWHTIGYTYDGSSAASGVQVVVDGSVVADTDNESTLSATMLNNEPFAVASAGGSGFAEANIAYVAIWNVVLTAQEISDYNAGGDLPRQDALVSFFRLNGGLSPEPDDKGASSGTVTGTIYDDSDTNTRFYNPLQTGFTDAGTAYVDITPAGTELQESVDSNTVYIDITPSAVELREISDADTVPILITPSAVENAQFVDSTTVGVLITPSADEQLSGSTTDSGTATVTITPSAIETRDAIDASTVGVVITPSAVENAQFVETSTVSLAITPSGSDTAQFVDSTTAYVDIVPSGTEDSAIVDAATVYVDIQPTSLDLAAFLDTSTIPVTITPSAADTAQFVDASTAYVTITPSGVSGNETFGTVYVKITPTTTVEQYVFFDTLFSAAISRRWAGAIQTRRWSATSTSKWSAVLISKRWGAVMLSRNWAATTLKRWSGTLGRS
jgi:hypothetical protein